LAGPVMRLAPTWPERKIEDSREFVAAYPARLSGVGRRTSTSGYGWAPHGAARGALL
jgi:hypothetical protein